MSLDPFSIIGLIITTVSLVFGIYFFFAAKREKSPCYGIRSEILVEGYATSLDGLSVKYKRKAVENLTVSRVVFWNDGRETIESKDLATVNPLRVQALNETRILDAKLLTGNYSSNCFSCEVGEDNISVYLKFDYLDRKQGAVFQVVHTGKSSRDIQVLGDIKGAPAAKNRLGPPNWVLLIRNIQPLLRILKHRIFKFIYGAVIVSAIAYLLIVGLGYSFLPYEILVARQPLDLNFYRLQGGIFLFFAITTIFLIIQLRRMESGVPKGLEIFFQDQFQTKLI